MTDYLSVLISTAISGAFFPTRCILEETYDTKTDPIGVEEIPGTEKAPGVEPGQEAIA